MQAPDCQMKDLWGAPEDFRLVQGSTGQEEVGSLGQVRGCPVALGGAGGEAWIRLL